MAANFRCENWKACESPHGGCIHGRPHVPDLCNFKSVCAHTEKSVCCRPILEIVTSQSEESTSCDRCEAVTINGVACHETGCPNSYSWRDTAADLHQ